MSITRGMISSVFPWGSKARVSSEGRIVSSSGHFSISQWGQLPDVEIEHGLLDKRDA